MEPRVISPECGYALPLTDLIEPYLGQRGVIAIHGPAGSGKTTALRHVAAAFPGRVAVFDKGSSDTDIECAADAVLIVRVGARFHKPQVLESFEMAPWGGDEAVEFLMTSHPQRCGDVMRRLGDHASEFQESSPRLWHALLDEMALVDGVGPRDALLAAMLRNPDTRWMQHRYVRDLVGGQTIARRVMNTETGSWPQSPSIGEIAEALRILAPEPGAVAALHRLWNLGDHALQPLVASLLVVLGDGWRPDSDAPCSLMGAHLAGASWPGVRLIGVACDGVNLDGAHLEAARLSTSDFTGASLRGAFIEGASLSGASFDGALLSGANLRNVRAKMGSFEGTCLAAADLTAACLEYANLDEANLREARLVRADLSKVLLMKAQIDGADFSRANLTGADLRGVDLRNATWTGARFEEAMMAGCRLDGMVLPGAILARANLARAHLTASVMPHASFRRAALQGALLADVSWEGADLRDANLARASFHMGSTRDGLVDSVIPCEGSRTGYYTDDYDEQAFKAPEEIRKANLCGADLRGARVEETDFYLVDLRGARYGSTQADHFRRCGAILQARKA